MVEVPFEARVLVGESSCLLESSLLSLGDSLIRRNQDLLYASYTGSAPSPNIMIKSAEISIMAQQSRLRKHAGGSHKEQSTTRRECYKAIEVEHKRKMVPNDVMLTGTPVYRSPLISGFHSG